jgi:SAM-dependent methyltransferase
MPKKDWWTPDNLVKQEKIIKQIDDINTLEGPDGGDFGSYRKVMKGVDINSTLLGMHNDLNSKNKISYIHKIIKVKKTSINDVLDVGCGMGYTTYELSKFYVNSKVVGVDVSSDAIDYAKQRFKSASFICQALRPTNQNIGQFDLIFCFEFYPFTRTSSIQTHIDYLTYFLSHLKPNGKLVIHHKWTNNDTMNSKSIELLERHFNQWQFKINRVPHAKVIKILKFRYLSLWTDWCIRKVLKKDFMKAVIISVK